MNTDRISNSLTLAANFGVLIGLIILIVEVRHAISLSESEAYRNRGTEIQEAYQELALSAELAEILVKSQKEGIHALSDVETVRLSAWNQAIALRMQNQFNDYHLGYLDESSYQSMLRAAARMYPDWQQVGLEIEDFDPRFVQAVENTAATPPKE